MRYVPSLDVVRALCVTGVFLHHIHLLDVGWAGVQAFFVLSGFLITNVLLEAKSASPSASKFFAFFYARRALRIFPAYFGYLVICYTLATLVGGQAGAWVDQQLITAAPSLVTYTYNFSTSHVGGPFLEHLWSLSVEEQFYLCWPFLVYTLDRRSFAKLALGLTLAGTLIRAVEAAIRIFVNPSASPNEFLYFCTLSHVDAFAVGALLCLRDDDSVADFLRILRKWLPMLFALASAAMLVGTLAFHYDIAISSLGWPPFLPYFGAGIWGYSLLNAVFACAIDSLLKRPHVEGPRILRRLGRVSYGFYIFHFPILAVAVRLIHADEFKHDLLFVGTSVAAFVLTWMCAELSYRCLEAPFLRMKDRFDGRATVGESPEVSA